MISVIVPVYKAEKFLNECIISILKQTYKNFELILVDDGSPDSCGRICDAYQCQDKRVTVVHKDNGGLPSARNAGLAVAKGDYITFVDADDFISSNFLESLLNNMIVNNSDVCMAKEIAVFYDNDNNLVNKIDYTTKNVSDYVDVNSFVMFCKSKGFCDLSTKLFKRDLFLNVEFDERTGWGEDFIFMYRLTCAHPHKLSTEMNAVYYYRHLLSQPSINRWQNKKMNVIIKELHLIYKNLIKEKKQVNGCELVLFYESCFKSRYEFCINKFLLFQLIWLIPYRISFFHRNKSFKSFLYSFLPYLNMLLVKFKHFIRG